MKKSILFALAFSWTIQLSAWWDPGHFVTAMIAYMNLEEPARKKVDELTRTLKADYPQLNHFITLGPWPDDLKADGVRAYDSWHYTNLPSNPDGISLPDAPEVDIIWAINESNYILKNNRTKAAEKARFLGFLVHFVSDLHQPLHSTSVFTDEQPGGNKGGNGFAIKSATWNNLHALWDDGCGYLSAYNDIRPYGKPKEPLTDEQINRLKNLATQLMKDHPESSFPQAGTLDPDFWALESHKLALQYGYRGVKGKDDKGRDVFLKPGDEPTDFYLAQGQTVVQRQLALSGYRLARMLNAIYAQ